MSSRERARAAFERTQDFQQRRREVVPALLGKGDGSTVKVNGKNRFYWVRLFADQSQLVMAFNAFRIRATYNLQVDVAVNTDRARGVTTYEIIGLASDPDLYSYDSSGGTPDDDPYLEAHGPTHHYRRGYPSADPVDVYPGNIAVGRVYQTSPASMRCLVAPLWYRHGGNLQSWPGGYTADLTSYVPALTGYARLVAVCIDGDSGALDYIAGTPFAWTGWTDPVPGAGVPAGTQGRVVLGSPLLYYGMTSVTETNFRYDIRPLFSTLAPLCDAGTEAERLAADLSGRQNSLWFETDTLSLWFTDGSIWYFVATLIPEYYG